MSRSCEGDNTKMRHIRINTKHINSSTSPMKQQILKEYIPKYREKLNLGDKQILEPSEDRLSELTTKQIDRLIEMEKIKNLLSTNKKGLKPTYIKYKDWKPNQHPNVYQPNFMAKINKIALQRDIKHLRSVEFDENVLTAQQKRLQGLKVQKKNLRFVKQYKADKKITIKNVHDDSEQKSIESINESVQEFQRNFKQRKQLTGKRNIFDTRSKYKETNLLSVDRWFNGMSTFYLEKGKKKSVRSNYESQPNRDYDFEHERSNSTILKKSCLNHSRLSTTMH